MPPLARRNLFHDKVRLTVTLTGIVFAVVLIVVELGLFVGFTSTTSGLVDHSGADLWVTSTNRFRSSASMWTPRWAVPGTWCKDGWKTLRRPTPSSSTNSTRKNWVSP